MISFTYNENYDRLSQEEQEMFTSFLHFCVDHLLKKERNSKKIYTVNFVFGVKTVNSGCIEVDSAETSRGKYKDYTIEFSSRVKKKNILTTLAHELVHMKQYASGDLNFGETLDYTIWKGKVYDERKVPYWLHPWELEAYGYEKCLYELWLGSIKPNLDKKRFAWLLK